MQQNQCIWHPYHSFSSNKEKFMYIHGIDPIPDGTNKFHRPMMKNFLVTETVMDKWAAIPRDPDQRVTKYMSFSQSASVDNPNLQGYKYLTIVPELHDCYIYFTSPVSLSSYHDSFKSDIRSAKLVALKTNTVSGITLDIQLNKQISFRVLVPGINFSMMLVETGNVEFFREKLNGLMSEVIIWVPSHKDVELYSFFKAKFGSIGFNDNKKLFVPTYDSIYGTIANNTIIYIKYVDQVRNFSLFVSSDETTASSWQITNQSIGVSYAYSSSLRKKIKIVKNKIDSAYFNGVTDILVFGNKHTLTFLPENHKNAKFTNFWGKSLYEIEADKPIQFSDVGIITTPDSKGHLSIINSELVNNSCKSLKISFSPTISMPKFSPPKTCLVAHRNGDHKLNIVWPSLVTAYNSNGEITKEQNQKFSSLFVFKEFALDEKIWDSELDTVPNPCVYYDSSTFIIFGNPQIDETPKAKSKEETKREESDGKIKVIGKTDEGEKPKTVNKPTLKRTIEMRPFKTVEPRKKPLLMRMSFTQLIFAFVLINAAIISIVLIVVLSVFLGCMRKYQTRMQDEEHLIHNGHQEATPLQMMFPGLSYNIPHGYPQFPGYVFPFAMPQYAPPTGQAPLQQPNYHFAQVPAEESIHNDEQTTKENTPNETQ